MEKRVKIIAEDNYDRENVSDILVAENVHESYAQDILHFLEEKNGEMGPRYFRIVPMSHKLYIWEP